MGEVIPFPTAKEDSDDTWGFVIEFTPENPNLNHITFTLDDLELDLPDPEVVNNYLNHIEKDLTLSPAMEHIRNLIELVDYNADLTSMSDWHKDMYMRATKYYFEHYDKTYNKE